MNVRFFLFLCFAFVVSNAKSQTAYYYYSGEKIEINIDREYLSINSKTNDGFLNSFVSFIASKTEFVENGLKNEIQKMDKESSNRIYYSEIQLIEEIKNDPKSYSDFINSLENNSAITKVSPCFKTSGGQRLGLTNSFYVKIKPNSYESLLTFALENDVEILGQDPFMQEWYVLSCSKSNPKNSLEYANLFYESGLFLFAEPEFSFHDLQTTIDPMYSSQWGLLNTGQYGGSYAGIDINAEQAWTITKGNNVKVAIYDQGVELNHPDLITNIYGTGYDAQNGYAPSIVRSDHGTPCAGVVGAIQNNSLGSSGVAPEADIVSISIDLSWSNTPAQLANGFNWAWSNGMEVISNSWGGYSPSNIITDAVYNAINLGRNGKGCVVVFAAGNENNTTIRYPGSNVPETIVVGAMSPCGQRKNPYSCDNEYWGSCYGSQLDVVAPGVKIPTTDRQGAAGYDNSSYNIAFNGTSSATPHVAGLAALILAVNPCLTALQVRNIIEQTAQKVGGYSYTTTAGRPNGTWNYEMGYGLIDAHAAVHLAQNLQSSDYVYIMDTITDTGLEPNNAPQNTWDSPDIWVRKSDDVGTTHEIPDQSFNGNPYYVKVRIHNKGCLPSTGNEQIKLYWAKETASLGYPNPWNGGFTHPTTGASMGGIVASVPIPVIANGQSKVVSIPWLVPNPLDYPNDPAPWLFKLLVRIDASTDLITYPETNNLMQNIKNNNNIAVKTISVVGKNH